MLERLANLFVYNPKEPLLFSSGLFLWLFMGFLVVYYLLRRKDTARIVFVTLFSYYFYYKTSGLCFLLLAFITVSDFYIAQMVRRVKRKKFWLVLSVVLDLGLLSYFKYTNFIFGSLSQIVSANFQPWDIFLPVGISFYIFQSLSYTIDVYRNRITPVRSLLDYAFYVSFFPSLVAGPIIRATDFMPQIRRPLRLSREMMATSVYFVAIGLFKKAVISDYISMNFVDRVFDNPSMFSGVEILLALYGYAVQIYCDFSGYSDMAIGIALLMGFHLPENFRSPFKADSLTDFWRRWHISLSSWIRDYVYISLGGNRKGPWRMYLNQMIAMTLCGLWHGASLNFVVWGALHGAGVCLHKFFRAEVFHHENHYQSSGWRRWVSVIITFHVVTFLWLFFREADFNNAQFMISHLFTRFNLAILPSVLIGYKYVFMLILFAIITHYVADDLRQPSIRMLSKGGVIGQAVVLALVIFIVIQVKSSTIQPFIYFQF